MLRYSAKINKDSRITKFHPKIGPENLALISHFLHAEWPIVALFGFSHYLCASITI